MNRSKRVADLALGSALLVVTAPIMAGCAAAVLLSDGAPALFRQTRIGLDERPFTLVKFRTMRRPRGEEIALMSDADRVTRVGQFLRRTSLDELPELWNVVRGDMSLIGPRPLLPVHLEVLTREQRRRHQVRPGITGLAQIRGRQHLTFSQRFALDVEYVDRGSARIDLRILVGTAAAVLRMRGVETGQAFIDVDDIGLADHINRSTLGGIP